MPAKSLTWAVTLGVLAIHVAGQGKESIAAENALVARTRTAFTAAAEAAAKGDIATAERNYLDALTASRRLPNRDYLIKSTVLDGLAKFYTGHGRGPEAEPLLLERVAMLQEYPRTPDLELGLALFELETYYSFPPQIEKAEGVASRAIAVYRSCAQKGPDARICDRRIADVQAFMGSILWNAKMRHEAEPWFKSVVDRPDDGVRPELMLLAMRAYAELLHERSQIEEWRALLKRAEDFLQAHPGSDKYGKPLALPAPTAN